jgi:hypothetical protein
MRCGAMSVASQRLMCPLRWNEQGVLFSSDVAHPPANLTSSAATKQRRRHSVNIALPHHVKLVICQPILLRMNGNSFPKVIGCYFPKNEGEAAPC